METKAKIPLLVLVSLALACLVAAAAVYAAVETYRAGVISIYVHEKHPGGKNVNVIVPAVVVPVAMRFFPRDELRRHSSEIQPWLPAARIAARELARSPDGPLVEVRSPLQSVEIVKSGGALVIDVDSKDETVHVSFPLEALRALLENIQESAGPV